MELSEALQKRKSVRAYLDKPVAAELMQKVFSQAQQAPSNCNSQPWLVNVFSGSARDKLQADILVEIESGQAPNPAFAPGDTGFVDVFKERQIDCAMSLYKAVGIGREDKAERQQLMLDNWRFFGAPCVAIISMPLNMQQTNALDVGIYLQSLMLAMVEQGLGCCAQGALALYPNAVRAQVDIPKEYGVICGLSFGYADDSKAINDYSMGRAELDAAVSFIS